MLLHLGAAFHLHTKHAPPLFQATWFSLRNEFAVLEEDLCGSVRGPLTDPVTALSLSRARSSLLRPQLSSSISWPQETATTRTSTTATSTHPRTPIITTLIPLQWPRRQCPRSSSSRGTGIRNANRQAHVSLNRFLIYLGFIFPHIVKPAIARRHKKSQRLISFPIPIKKRIKFSPSFPAKRGTSEKY